MKIKYSIESNNSLPKFDKSVSFVCWAYNEEQLITGFLLRANELLKKNVENYEIVVVDDGSTDKTNGIIRALQEKIPQIKLIRNQVNMNVGFSSRKAIMSATKDYLFWQTIDWAYDISLLRTFLELLKPFDIVAGTRRYPGETKSSIKRFLSFLNLENLTNRSDTIAKAVISMANYSLIRLLFNVPLSDYQNVVFYPTKLIQSLALESNSSFANPEGLIKAYWKGVSIVEVPIPFIPRILGQGKGTRISSIKASISDIFKAWFKLIILNQRGTPKIGTVKRLKREEWKD